MSANDVRWSLKCCIRLGRELLGIIIVLTEIVSLLIGSCCQSYR